MLVTIHQPEYLPCLPLLAKLGQAELCVMLDDVQFNRSSLQQRARIAGPTGNGAWMTIPFVHAFPQSIDAVQIADPKWSDKHRTALYQHYMNAPHWLRGQDLLGEVVESADFLKPLCKNLATVTSTSMILLSGAFNVHPEFRRADRLDLPADVKKGDRVLAICKAVGATGYLSGHAGSRYLDLDAFKAADIDVYVNSYVAPSYREGIDAELHRISALDAVMWLEAPTAVLAGATMEKVT